MAPASRPMHAVIVTAFSDAQAAREIEEIGIGMVYDPKSATWHEARGDGRCEICLAGARIARWTGFNPNATIGPSNLNAARKREALCLNAVMNGDWERAARLLWDVAQRPDPHNTDGARTRARRFEHEMRNQLGNERTKPQPHEFTGWETFDRFEADMRARILPAIKHAEHQVHARRG